MMKRSGSFHLFHGKQVSEYLTDHTERLQKALQSESENYILNVNEEAYIDHLVGTYRIATPQIDFEGVFLDTYEKEIPAEAFPPMVYVRPGKTYPKQVLVYHLPFTGNVDLLRCTPREFQSRFPFVFLEGNDICFEYVVFGNDLTEIRTQANSEIETMRFFLERVRREVEEYNAQVPASVKGLFQARKQQFLENRQVFASLGVPLRKREDLPATYALPALRAQKKVSLKPQVTEQGYTPEPTLDQSTYQEILQIIQSMGKVFETLPATYFQKGEEDLRDHLLLQLASRFKDEGSVTGETFSKVGKTDIVYRYANSNAFVAECKFWKGQSQYLETMNQLLSYLVWRDSKAAVIIFVKNKEMSSVLETVREATPQHPNYLGLVNEQDVAWLNYRFHINDDPNREVKVAVMLYHIPEVYGGRVKRH